MDAWQDEQWAPLNSNVDNDWVLVGMLNKDPSSTCRTYMQLHHKEPTWGVDGSSTELKKHILCCEGDSSSASSLTDMVVGIQDNSASGINDAGNESASNTVVDGSLTNMVVGIQDISTSSSTGTSNASASTPAEVSIMNTFHPMWYDATAGWSGGSHDDAIHVGRLD